MFECLNDVLVVLVPTLCVNAIKLSPKTFFCRVGKVFLLPTCRGWWATKRRCPPYIKSLTKVALTLCVGNAVTERNGDHA